MILFYSGVATAQKNKVDLLIDNIHNNQIYATCNYNWVLNINSAAADSLVKTGKSVSKKLIPLLGDSEKGIIAHFILSKIWNINLDKSTALESYKAEDGQNYNFNGLSFYEKDGIMVTNLKVLLENKTKWVAKISEF